MKLVYLPHFITAKNPLWSIDYHEFVRGCHLGIFPSYYEPWGYTPLEYIASDILTTISDLTGFEEYYNDSTLPKDADLLAGDTHPRPVASESVGSTGAHWTTKRRRNPCEHL